MCPKVWKVCCENGYQQHRLFGLFCTLCLGVPPLGKGVSSRQKCGWRTQGTENSFCCCFTLLQYFSSLVSHSSYMPVLDRLVLLNFSLLHKMKINWKHRMWCSAYVKKVLHGDWMVTVSDSEPWVQLPDTHAPVIKLYDTSQRAVMLCSWEASYI